MKQFIDYLREAEERHSPKSRTRPRPSTFTATDAPPDINLGPDLNGPTHHDIARLAGQPGYDRPQGNPDPVDPRRRASAGDTMRATRNVSMTPDMASMLSRMRDIEADPDDPGYPDTDFGVPDVRVTIENLPMVANQALRAAGVQNPAWHQVARLPGNMRTAIRTVGRRLFGTYTNTPTDDIYMIGDLRGMGPNTNEEVQAVANYVRENGEDLGAGDIDFNQFMPGYTADVHQYSVDGVRWLLVQDQFGNYIYSWPEEDSKELRNRRELEYDDGF
jgi:hypothetical protein